jgi:hypothetical protein
LILAFESGKYLNFVLGSLHAQKKRIKIKTIDLFMIKRLIYYNRAAIPGNVFPSKLSSIAPPPVEM